MPTPTESQVLDALRAVIDPELGLDVVTLGMVYGVDATDPAEVVVRMTLTTRGCPLAGLLTASARVAVKAVPGVADARVDLVWEPAWTPDRITPAGRERLRL